MTAWRSCIARGRRVTNALWSRSRRACPVVQVGKAFPVGFRRNRQYTWLLSEGLPDAPQDLAHRRASLKVKYQTSCVLNAI
jgi:hypothetical protein